MRYGAVLPGGTAPEQLELARAGRAGRLGRGVRLGGGLRAGRLDNAGGDGGQDASVRLGTMLTPLPWRRPWKVASQVATLDQLSGGRAILAVGVGALDTDLPATGEVTACAAGPSAWMRVLT